MPDPSRALVHVAIVNYGTPELTRMAVWSLHSLYPNLPITVVDNDSPDDSLGRLRALQQEVSSLRILSCDENLHHGPGLDHALRETSSEWLLTFDSDCIAYREGFLEKMLSAAESRSAYMIGDMHTVDDAGYDVPGDRASETGHSYIHPKCALVRRATYLALPPFEKHGAPCLTNQVAAVRQGETLVDFPVGEYVFHQGRGTVERSGYGLGMRGWVNKFRHYMHRLT